MNCLTRWRTGLARILLLAAAFMCREAGALGFGVNIHHGGDAAFNAGRAAEMKKRNLVTARMDLIWDWDQASLRDQVRRIRANGGTVEAVLMTSHQWDSSCNQDLGLVERKAYREASIAVDQVKDLIQDFELLNETQLRPEIRAETDWNSIGMRTGPYEGKPCVASLAAALRGMARAIADIRASSGQPLRIILGEVGRDWGFLKYMQAQGVLFDVIGWHVYQKASSPSMIDDPWWGPGGPYAQLALFGKPVHVNEFNCGETYEPAYENEAGRPATERCLDSFARHMRDLVSQRVADIESVHVYELLDEPSKATPENRFGLMYDLGRPKPLLFLLTAFSGGELSSEERREITRRGLMTDAEIDARQPGRSSARLPVTTGQARQSPQAAVDRGGK